MKKIFLFIIQIIIIACLDCNNPYLNQNVNLWAPLSFLSLMQTHSSLNFCKNLEGKQSCCSKNMFDNLESLYTRFKEEFRLKSLNEIRARSDRVENLTRNEQKIIDSFKNTKEIMEASKDLYKILKDNLTEIDKNLPKNSSIKELRKLNYPTYLSEVEKYVNDDKNSNSVNSSLKIISQFRSQMSTILKDLPGNLSNLSETFFLDTMNETEVKKNIYECQLRLRNFITARGECFSSLMKHYSSIICLYCDADYKNNGVSYQNNEFKLELNSKVCNIFMEKCYNYLNASKEMNINSEVASNMESILLIRENIEQSNFKFETLIEFINERQRSINKFFTSYPVYKIPKNCSEKKNCSFICDNYPEVTTINIEKILNFHKEKKTTFKKMSINGVKHNLVFGNAFSFNTYDNALNNGANYFMDGAGGFGYFNKSGNVTKDSLKIINNINKLRNGNKGKKNHPDFIWFTCLILFILHILILD